MNPKVEFKNLAAVQSAVLWPCLAALALVLTLSARAQTFTDADWVSFESRQCPGPMAR